MPNAEHRMTRIGIWTLILLLPVQGIAIEVRACGLEGTSCCGTSAASCSCCHANETHSCCHSKSKDTRATCCHGSNSDNSLCHCGLGCPCGKGEPVSSPAVPSQDSDPRSDIVSHVGMVNTFASAIEIKCPQQPVQVQLLAIQSLSVDRCSTLCRYTL